MNRARNLSRGRCMHRCLGVEVLVPENLTPPLLPKSWPSAKVLEEVEKCFVSCARHKAAKHGGVAQPGQSRVFIRPRSLVQIQSPLLYAHSLIRKEPQRVAYPLAVLGFLEIAAIPCENLRSLAAAACALLCPVRKLPRVSTISRSDCSKTALVVLGTVRYRGFSGSLRIPGLLGLRRTRCRLFGETHSAKECHHGDRKDCAHPSDRGN